MLAIVEIGQYKYWTDLLNAKQTSENFEKSLSKRIGYDKWMAGRRAGEYATFAHKQSLQIHGIALVVMDEGPVCTCGLIAKLTDVDEADNPQALFGHPGHINNSTKKIVTAFYIWLRSEGEAQAPLQLHFFCQICLASEPTGQTDDEDIDALPLEEFRTLHAHNDQPEAIKEKND